MGPGHHLLSLPGADPGSKFMGGGRFQ